MSVAVRLQRTCEKQEASLRTAGQRESCDRHISRSRNRTMYMSVTRTEPKRHVRYAKKDEEVEHVEKRNKVEVLITSFALANESTLIRSIKVLLQQS